MFLKASECDRQFAAEVPAFVAEISALYYHRFAIISTIWSVRHAATVRGNLWKLLCANIYTKVRRIRRNALACDTHPLGIEFKTHGALETNERQIRDQLSIFPEFQSVLETVKHPGGKDPIPFPSPADWRDQVIYFLMVDRFNNKSWQEELLHFWRGLCG